MNDRMTALGRILQVIGWLWIAVGFFGPLVALPNVSVFPGIIVLFISRVMRKQAERAQRPEDGGEAVEEPEEQRMLNTERRHQTAAEPPPRVERGPVVPEQEKEREDLLERVLLAGKAVSSDEMAEKPIEPEYPEIDLSRSGRMSSAEMIARAHRRWDRRP